jgi:hypothetical protein
MPDNTSLNTGSLLLFEATCRIIVIAGARQSVAALSGGRPTRATAPACLVPRSVTGVRNGVARMSGELDRTVSTGGYFGKKRMG